MKRIVNNLPIIMYVLVLLFTNIIGVALLIWGPLDYWKVSHIFSGVSMPDLYVEDVVMVVCVTVLPLLALIVCYLVGRKVADRICDKSVCETITSRKVYCYNVFSLLIFLYVFMKIFSYVDVSDVGAWLNNNDFYEKRSILMSGLRFVDFVIIYSILPMAVGWVYCVNKGMKGKILFVLELFLYVVVNIYIFQKRPLMMGLIFIAAVIVLKDSERFKTWNIKRVLKFGIIGLVALYLIYAAGITANTVNEGDREEYLVSVEKADLTELFGKIKDVNGEQLSTDETIGEETNKEEIEIAETEVQETLSQEEISSDVSQNDVEKPSNKADEETSDVESVEPGEVVDKETTNVLVRSFELSNDILDVPRFTFTQMMAYVGMLNRTAYATIVDIVAFPEYQEFYPIDIGLDILGFGTCPDENLLAGKILYPGIDNPGSYPVPYYVALYTQGGVLVAIIGSIIVGLSMGFCWGWLLKRMNVHTILFGALIVSFSTAIAINSGRNALLASDGAIWPLLLLGMLFVADAVLTKIWKMIKS